MNFSSDKFYVSKSNKERICQNKRHSFFLHPGTKSELLVHEEAPISIPWNDMMASGMICTIGLQLLSWATLGAKVGNREHAQERSLIRGVAKLDEIPGGTTQEPVPKQPPGRKEHTSRCPCSLTAQECRERNNTRCQWHYEHLMCSQKFNLKKKPEAFQLLWNHHWILAWQRHPWGTLC